MAENIFGYRLRELRTQQGLRAIDLAKMVGISNQTTICKYENGDTKPSTDRVMQFVEVLGTSVEYLTGGLHEDELTKYFPKPPGWLMKAIQEGDWHDKTFDEIAAVVGGSRNSVKEAIYTLKGKGIIIEYKGKTKAESIRKAPPPKPKKQENKNRVSKTQCKGCVYWFRSGPLCEYYLMTGQHRQPPVNGKCPCRRAGKRRFQAPWVAEEDLIGEEPVQEEAI